MRTVTLIGEGYLLARAVPGQVLPGLYGNSITPNRDGMGYPYGIRRANDLYAIEDLGRIRRVCAIILSIGSREQIKHLHESCL